MTSLWSDLDRPPLSERALRAALVRPGGFVRAVHVVAETGSTNADLAEVARRGGPEGVVLVAEAQTGALAYELLHLVDDRIGAQQRRVFAAAGAMSQAELDRLPEVDVELGV